MKNLRFNILFGFLLLCLTACTPSSSSQTSSPTLPPLAFPTSTLPTGPADTATPIPADAILLPEGDPVIFYSVDGGIAGFCDTMEVFANGSVVVESCNKGREAIFSMTEADFTRMSDWISQYRPFDFEQGDGGAVADGMTISLNFNGFGDEMATIADRTEILKFLSGVWAGAFEINANDEIQDTSPEAILITNPGPGSRLTSPMQVTGIADPTFEQNLVVRVVLADGTEFALTSTTVQADIGERGAFEVDIPFSIEGDVQAFIQVYSTSARDGGTTHLSSLGVTLSENGPADIRPAVFQGERIEILSPAAGNVISGGAVQIEGVGLASFEGTLVVRLLDENGNVLIQQPIIVASPDIGMPGTFAIELPYTVTERGAARIVVSDPSPAFGGDSHVSSVEITLEP